MVNIWYLFLGGGCGVGIGLGWGFGAAYGAHYVNSKPTFEGIDFDQIKPKGKVVDTQQREWCFKEGYRIWSNVWLIAERLWG
mgnify:FL=1